MHILPAFHGTTQNAHVCGCVQAHCELRDLAKPEIGTTVPNIVLLSLIHVFEHVQKGMMRLKIRNPYHRRKTRNRFYLSPEREDLKGIGGYPQTLEH